MIRACAPCGVIFAPRHAPATCPECDGTLVAVTLQEALDLVRTRMQRLRPA